MKKLFNEVNRFIVDEEGLTALEYVIAAALLAVALATLFSGYGSTLQSKLTSSLARFT